MNGLSGHHDVSAEGLCLTCGLCCNGVIFADVQLQPADDPVRLQALGLKFRLTRPKRQRSQIKAGTKVSANTVRKFPQPCRMFDGCRCNIYADRPKYCREFACALLKSVEAGNMAPIKAEGIIRTAHQRVKRVMNLLEALGDKDQHLAFAGRFRRTAKRLEKAGFDETTADAFGQLTLEAHDLNLLLSHSFYPGLSASEDGKIE